MSKLSLSRILTEEQPPQKETVWVLLDTFQSDDEVFTGVSKTREGIERLKNYVINRYKITDMDQLSQLHIYEVPLDTFFEKRIQLDKKIHRFG